ncbi:MAG TPA: acyl-ACP thioesterase domain-containing protein [Solirubrobacteraceae bacterium]|nr:acyl-ACP thioesterase domain-containing protein [Solirubrobacteraceae bacterium]
MSALPSPTELVAPRPEGRQFSLELWPGLGDCAPSGRIRLDAIARWLQDVAYADVADAGLAETAYWVVRRNRILVRRWPRFAGPHTVTTFCSGLGRMWAERRTTVAAPGADEPAVESVALWVHLDPRTRLPAPFSDTELEAYREAAGGRRVRARLRHPAPPAGASARRWQFRAVDCDIAGHVNNAAYWQPVEEELLERADEPTELDAEIEFRAGAQPGEQRVLADGEMRWITDAGGLLLASIAARAHPTAQSDSGTP